MNSDRQPRHLAAILYADVVGFSRMSEADEEGTFLKVRNYLDNFAEIITLNHGEVIKYAGDAVLAIFTSATDALICAAQVQASTAERNQDLHDDDKVRFRIGLNLGDIIKDRGDVFGDGVNVAARLEALAKPEGICVSGSFYDAIAMRLPFDFEFMGEQQVKNISKPIRAYHASLQEGSDLPVSAKIPTTKSKSQNNLLYMVIGIAIAVSVLFAWLAPGTQETMPPETASAQPASKAAMPLQQHAIIVLPFDDISSESDQDYFVDGITEDIITDLSRLSGLKVLARNTSFQYKGTTVTPIKIRQELNVAYMLEGSVRKAGNKIRVTAQLIDTETAHQIWADRYDRDLTDVFAVQDDVTQNIINALALHLTDQDKAALTHRRTNSIEAYEMFLRGQRLYRIRTMETNKQAQETLKEAIKLDPSYARSYGTLALSLTQAVNAVWTENPVEDSSRALELARKAVSLDDQSPHAYWSLAFTHLYRNEHQEAIDAVQRSIEISPSYADAYALLALIKVYFGEAEEAIEVIKESMDLNPHYSWDYLWILGFSYYTLGQLEKANEYFERALERNPNSLRPILSRTATFMELGMQDEAEWDIEQLVEFYQILTISQLAARSPIADAKALQKFLSHLRGAGLPE